MAHLPTRRLQRGPQRYATIQQLVDVGLMQLPLWIRGKRHGQEVHGQIAADGIPTWQGRSYTSLSASAGDALATITGLPKGTYPSFNGCEFWEYQDANGIWEPLHTLRERYD